jgi:hypothetical protein
MNEALLIPVYVTGGYSRSPASPADCVRPIAEAIAAAYRGNVTDAVEAGIIQYLTQQEFWLTAETRRLQESSYYRGKSEQERRGYAMGSLEAEVLKILQPERAKSEAHYAVEDRDEQRGLPLPRTDAEQDEPTPRVA